MSPGSLCGGLLPAKRQIEILMNEGLMWLGSGLTDPEISMTAALALFSAFGLNKPAALNGPQFLTTDVLAKPLQISKGSATVPSGPGLGM
jgi:muconate cycloisomerase